MIKYRKFYDDDFINVSDPGSKIKEVWEMENPNGSEFDIKLSENPIDIQEYIDSYRDSCDIDMLIARFTNGDISAIPPITELSDVDLSVFPDNIHELNERVMAADQVFASLPEDIKSKFSDINDFYDSVGTEKFINAFTNVEKIEVPSEPSVNVD